jgi:NAD(P)H-quinone oxidoreductase subunit 6
MQIAEGVQLVTFAILSILMLGAALGVVLFANIVYSAFLLGGVFISECLNSICDHVGE